MSLILENRKNISEDDWDNIVEVHPDGTYYGLSRWLDGVLSVNEWDLKEYSFGVFENNKIVAIVPIQYNAQAKSLYCAGWGWCPPLIINENKKIGNFIFNEIDKLAMNLKVVRVQVGSFGYKSLNGSLNTKKGINACLFYGFEDVSSYSQIINLENLSEELLFQGISQTAKQTIRKAEKKLTVKLVSWKEHLYDYYQMHKENYKKSNLKPHPFRYFQMISELKEKNHRLFACFNEKEEVIAYHNDLVYKSSVFYHTGTSIAGAGDLGANYLLTWKAILYAHNKKEQYYEVGEIPLNSDIEKHSNIGFFKTRFGGDLYRMLKFQKKYNWYPKIEALKGFYRSLKKLMKVTVDL